MANMTLGQRIRERRKELGLSQEELAKRLGNKSRASVCTVEKDKEDLTTTRIRQYAEALECSPAYLMGWEIQGQPDDNESKEDFVKKATALYRAYTDATPEIQSAIDTLIKASPRKK